MWSPSITARFSAFMTMVSSMMSDESMLAKLGSKCRKSKVLVTVERSKCPRPSLNRSLWYLSSKRVWQT